MLTCMVMQLHSIYWPWRSTSLLQSSTLAVQHCLGCSDATVGKSDLTLSSGSSCQDRSSYEWVAPNPWVTWCKRKCHNEGKLRSWDGGEWLHHNCHNDTGWTLCLSSNSCSVTAYAPGCLMTAHLDNAADSLLIHSCTVYSFSNHGQRLSTNIKWKILKVNLKCSVAWCCRQHDDISYLFRCLTWVINHV